MQYTLLTSTRYNKQALHKFLVIFCFLTLLLSITTDTAQADSPPNISTDIRWTDTGGVFDLSTNPQTLDATFNGVVDTMAAFNHARRQEEIQLNLADGVLGLLDLPEQTIWDGMSDDEKALFILNEERTDRTGMLPNVLGLPLEGIETNIDNIAQAYAQILVDNDAFGHEEDGRKPWERVDDDPVIGPCHEFLTRTENLAAFWAGAQSPLHIERSFYNWIYADGISAWGHREAAFLQDIPLGRTDPSLGFKNNVGTPDSEGFLGIGVIHSADYKLFDTNTPGIGTIVVMNFFDPLPSETCTWGAAPVNTPTSIPSTPIFTSTPMPTVTNTATNTVISIETSTNTPSPTAFPTSTSTPTPAPTDTNTPLPTATSTPTPAPTDTNTPLPTATSMPTPAPTDTNTPLPTATSTPTPAPTDTNTPLPTETLVPSPTSSPIPTNTPTSNLPLTATWTPTINGLPTETPMPISTETLASPLLTSTPMSTPVPTLTSTSVPTEPIVATDTPVPTATVVDPLSGASPHIHDSFEPETHTELQTGHHTVTGVADNVSNIDLNVTFNADLSEYVYDEDRNVVEGKVVFDIHYENSTGDVDSIRAIPDNGSPLDTVVIVATISEHTLFDPTSSGFVSEAGASIPQDVVWQNLDGSGPVESRLPSGDDIAIRVGDLTPRDSGKLQISMLLGNNVRPKDLTNISLSTTIAATNLEHQIFYRLTDSDSAAQIEIQRSFYLPIIIR